MSKTMEYFLSSPHWLDAMTPPLEQHIRVLVQTVKALLSPESQTNAGFRIADPSPQVAASGATAVSDPLANPVAQAIWTTPRRRLAWIAGALAAVALCVVLAASIFFGGKPPDEKRAAVITADAPAGSIAEEASSQTPLLLPTEPVSSPDQELPAKDKPFDRPSPPVPGVRSTAQAAEPAFDRIALRNGPIMCRSAGVNVRVYSSGSLPEEEGPLANRLTLVTNQHEMPVSEMDLEAAADLTFQVNNQSAETVTLSQIQVLLLGVISNYEDTIAEPEPPRVSEWIEDLVVDESSPPRKEYADLREVFADDDTSEEDLEYKIVSNTNPELVTAVINSQAKLDLSFAASQTGSAEIVVAAVDPFDMSAQCSFNVEVREREPERPPQVITLPLCPPPLRVNDPRHFSSKAPPFRVIQNPLCIGTLVFAHVLRNDDLVIPCASGNLLPEHNTEILEPNHAKTFRVHIGCWTRSEMPDAGSYPDSLIAFADHRRKLKVGQPALVKVYHLLAVCARIISEDGESQDLYSDHLYLLESDGGPTTAGRADSRLWRGTEVRLDNAASALVASLLKSHGETVAYRRAQLCGAIPDNFDATAVSHFCYYGDPTSPFRAKASASRFSERDRWPRSNAIDVLACLQRENPVLWRLIHGQLVELASGMDAEVGTEEAVDQTRLGMRSSSRRPGDHPIGGIDDPFGFPGESAQLAAKAKALEQELRTDRPSWSLVRSVVRIESRPGKQVDEDAKPERPPSTEPPDKSEPRTPKKDGPDAPFLARPLFGLGPVEPAEDNQ